MNAEAKAMCLGVLYSMLERKELTGVRKIAKALGISQAKTKTLLDGVAEDHTQDDIIRYTAALIKWREEE